MNTILQGQIKGADKELSNLSNRQRALRNIGGRPNKNLLINAYFVGGGSQQGEEQFPINQREQTSYSANGMTIDRWPLAVSTGNYSVTLEEDGLSFVFDAGTTIFSQRIPDNIWNEMLGKTVTISILDGTGLHTNTVDIPEALPVDTGNVHFGNGMTSDIFASSGALPQFRIYNYNGLAASAKIRAAKVELGSVQTLAYQDEDGNWQLFETPDFQEELAKCQAYQVAINTLDIIGGTNHETILYATIPTPVTMRALPTIENNGVFNVRGGGTNQINLTATTYSTSLNANGIRVGIAGTFTINEPYHVSITTPIILNANL